MSRSHRATLLKKKLGEQSEELLETLKTKPLAYRKMVYRKIDLKVTILRDRMKRVRLSQFPIQNKIIRAEKQLKLIQTTRINPKPANIIENSMKFKLANYKYRLKKSEEDVDTMIIRFETLIRVLQKLKIKRTRSDEEEEEEDIDSFGVLPLVDKYLVSLLTGKKRPREVVNGSSEEEEDENTEPPTKKQKIS